MRICVTFSISSYVCELSLFHINCYAKSFQILFVRLEILANFGALSQPLLQQQFLEAPFFTHGSQNQPSLQIERRGTTYYNPSL